MRTLSLHLSAIYTPHVNCSYWTSASFAALSPCVASYMVSVRQTGGLPKASFRFHITMDTLAVGYVLTATRSHLGLAPIRVRPCWANKKGSIKIMLPNEILNPYAINSSYYYFVLSLNQILACFPQFQRYSNPD